MRPRGKSGGEGVTVFACARASRAGASARPSSSAANGTTFGRLLRIRDPLRFGFAACRDRAAPGFVDRAFVIETRGRERPGPAAPEPAGARVERGLVEMDAE